MSEPKTITLAVGGRSFDFQLHQRELLFGRAGAGQYFWMDGRQLRRGAGGPNFRPCVDLWWHVNELAGTAADPSTEMNLVLAECYPLINTSKSVQDVYMDAHLHRLADRESDYVKEGQVRKRKTERTDTLPDEEIERLYSIGHYIGCPDFDELQASGAYLQTKEYRDMVATILVAAHEYDRSRRRWEDQRGQGTPTDREVDDERHRDDGTASPHILFKNYTDRRRESCSECSGALSFIRHELLEEADSPTVLAFFRCEKCNRERQLRISEEDLLLTQRF